MSPLGPLLGRALLNLNLLRKPISKSALTRKESRLNPSFIILDTEKGINYSDKRNANISLFI
jgi:hypothetical protein